MATNTFSAEEKAKLQSYIDETVEIRPAFEKSEYDRRLDKLHKKMTKRNLDAVLLASPESQCWLHGYESRWYRAGSTTEWPPLNFTVVTTDPKQILVLDSNDHRKLVHLTSFITDDHFRPVEKFSLDEVHKELIAVAGLKAGQNCGIEMWSPRQNAATTTNLLAHLRGANIDVEDVSVMMRQLQRVKSDAELAVMRNAARILDHAYAELRHALSTAKGLTERQAWAVFETSMARDGGETAALHNTFARTRNYYHAISTNRVIGNGQFHADPSAVLHRYHVNAARQFYLLGAGEQKPKTLLRASKIAAGALDVIHEHAKPELEFRELANELRKYYKTEGLWDDDGTLRDWIGGYQLGISFTPDWVGEFTWSVDEANEPDHYFETKDPSDRTPKQQKMIEPGLVTNFESYVGGAGLIETIVFRADKGIDVLTRGTEGELDIIDLP